MKKKVLSLMIAMMMAICIFSPAALAADKPQNNEDYYSVLNTLEEKQTSLIEKEGTLCSEALKEEIKIKDELFETDDWKLINLGQNYCETEVNDDFSAADVINNDYAGYPNYIICGQINDDYQDIDTYQIALSISGSIYLDGYWDGEHENEGMESQLIFGLFDSSENLIASSIYYGDSIGSISADLEAGTYYIKVLQDDTYQTMFVDEQYRIYMDFVTHTQQSVFYQTNVQSIGWQDWRCNGGVAGTSGQSLRLEGLRISLGDNWWYEDTGIEYQTHVQNVGWTDWVSDGDISGVTGKSLRMEAIKIRLYGNLVEEFDVYYRVHAQNFGWMDWAKNGQSAGTEGFSYRLEAIQIKLVEKGDPAPGSTATPFVNANANDPQVNMPSTEHSVRYQTHVQDVGWQGWKCNGEMAGTSGRSLRLEGMYIEIEGANNAIEYRTHVQNIGWQDWVRDGAMTGTSGQSLRLEAIDIRLTGDMASRYDIYYRVHAQNFGWMGWAKNGQSAGTAGFSYRLEAIQIVLVAKDGAAPGSTANAFVQK